MKHTSRRPLAIGAAIAASAIVVSGAGVGYACLLYTSPSPRD